MLPPPLPPREDPREPPRPYMFRGSGQKGYSLSFHGRDEVEDVACWVFSKSF